MVNFDFLEKGLGIVSPPHLVCHFPKKMFLMLYFINWSNFIVWLLLLLEIFGNMCMVIVCFPGCDVMNFEINLILLINILIILRKKRVLKVKLKAFFIILKVLSVAKNFLRPVSTPLTGVLIYSLTICVLEDGFKDICSENFVIFAEKNSWPSSLLVKSQFVEPDFFWRKRSAKYIS